MRASCYWLTNHEKTSAGWQSREKLIANNFYHKRTMGARNDHEHLVLA
jgi:hypothetical protein